MRIGIDMLAMQSPGSRLRGIGRYARGLVSALLASGGGHEYVLYFHEDYPSGDGPASPNAESRLVRVGRGGRPPSRRDAISGLVAENPDRLDWLVLLNPFELCPDYAPPATPRGDLRIASVIHDFIPFLWPESYLTNPRLSADFHRRLGTIRDHDLLLANSEATRDDALRLLGLAEGRVASISGGCDAVLFGPDRRSPMPPESGAVLDGLGIDRGFVLCIAAGDERKNVRGLIDAFALLPFGLRSTHQLVIACDLDPTSRSRFLLHAEGRGVAADLVLTGEVSDPHLLVLYQRCAAFAFPSHYEGLGLPLLEAMSCGAAVVAGRNSSQIEVVGDAGRLSDSRDPRDVAARLEEILSDPVGARSLGDRAIERASKFTWERSAGLALSALSRRPSPRKPGLDPGNRPRIAIRAPFPPRRSRLADFAQHLVHDLSRDYRIDLFHDRGYLPDLGLPRRGPACFDARLLARVSRARAYRSILVLGEDLSEDDPLLDSTKDWPGIVSRYRDAIESAQRGELPPSEPFPLARGVPCRA